MKESASYKAVSAPANVEILGWFTNLFHARDISNDERMETIFLLERIAWKNAPVSLI